MLFGHILPCLLQHILLSAPSPGSVYLNKTDISDGFYWVNLAPSDAPKLALAFPTRLDTIPLVTIPLVLPMGWKNSLPLFCVVTKAIAELQMLHCVTLKTLHPPCPQQHSKPFQQPHPQHLTQNLNHTTGPATPAPSRPSQICGCFVDDFVGMAQHPHLAQVRCSLLYAINYVM